MRLSTETGFQLDGIPTTEPFFSQNGSNGRFNGIGSVQIVEGAGDATHGKVGGGGGRWHHDDGAPPAATNG